uniref:Uncharacterized protein n=1 Tax=Knipowitschia caucasica TaxID=637954 RepID=A0AAV2K1T0_KNICA
MAKVHHSQALSEPPLKPWVSLQRDGTVLCGHCTCEAGLGESVIVMPLTELYDPRHRKSASERMVRCEDAFIDTGHTRTGSTSGGRDTTTGTVKAMA